MGKRGVVLRKRKVDPERSRLGKLGAEVAKVGREAVKVAYEGEMRELGDGWAGWVREVERTRNFRPAEFLKLILEGKFEVKLKDAAGLGMLGVGSFVPREFQRRWYREVLRHRRGGEGRFNRLVVKSRQLGFSVGHDVMLTADAFSNAAAGVVITAHQDDTLRALSDNIKTFLGRDKTKGMAKGMAMKRFETHLGSVIQLLGAKDSLGRGDAPLHLHVSEADYIEDLDSALDSILPAVNRSSYATVVLESTMRFDATGGYKDFLDRSRLGKTKYPIHFLGWRDDETAVVPVGPARHDELVSTLSEYERDVLLGKHKCSMEQLNWWRTRFEEDARSNLLRMQEMNPADLDEALTGSVGTAFFDEAAMQFLREHCSEPEKRMRARYESFEEIESANEWLNSPHWAVWETPGRGQEYVIGADGADASNRVDWEVGSECYAVVLNKRTGEQVAEWHGHANPQEFAIALWRAARYYNGALVVPEKNACQGVIDYLMSTLEYRNVYERETFGAVVTKYSGLYGFDTRGQSRANLVQRVQDNVNRKTLLLRSKYLVAQLENFGKRKGRPNKSMGRRGEQADDGPIALGLCMFGHNNAVNGAWTSKDALDYSVVEVRSVTTTDRAMQARGHFRNDDWDDERGDADVYLNRS